MEKSPEVVIKCLIDMYLFYFKLADFVIDRAYPKTTLHIVWDVKQDLLHKEKLVAGGNLVDILNNNTYYSTIDAISVKLLHVIAHKKSLDKLFGNMSNAHVNTYTNDKVYTISGIESGDIE